MRALFIMNGVTFGDSGKPAISGGDAILIEMSKRWIASGVDVHFLTSVAGKILCENASVKATYHLSSTSSNPSVLNYLSIALKATKKANELKKLHFDIVYSSCEHIYDVLPALKLKSDSTNWAAMVHFVPPPPWARLTAGGLNALLCYFNHASGAYLIRFSADIIYAVSDRSASDFINKMRFNRIRIKSVPGGLSYTTIRSIATTKHNKKYDAVFMKRLQPMKGVFDLIKIWRQVVNSCPEAKLLIIGDGPSNVVLEMREMIENFNLQKNIILYGPVYDDNTKFSLLASSKLFLLPSHEENWALVVGEAMAAGLPIIIYELPEIKDIWQNNVFWVPKGDLETFAKKVVNLLTNPAVSTTIVERGISFVEKFDWDVIARDQLLWVESQIKKRPNLSY
jgi:glycosyltransferase involved in cell wall biosynthesis